MNLCATDSCPELQGEQAIPLTLEEQIRAIVKDGCEIIKHAMDSGDRCVPVVVVVVVAGNKTTY